MLVFQDNAICCQWTNEMVKHISWAYKIKKCLIQLLFWGVTPPHCGAWEGRWTTWCLPPCGRCIRGVLPFCERVNYLIK
jgi:hypothetical protein